MPTIFSMHPAATSYCSPSSSRPTRPGKEISRFCASYLLDIGRWRALFNPAAFFRGRVTVVTGASDALQRAGRVRAIGGG